MPAYRLNAYLLRNLSPPPSRRQRLTSFFLRWSGVFAWTLLALTLALTGALAA